MSNPRDKTAPPIPLDEVIQRDTALRFTAAIISDSTDLSALLKEGETCAHGTARIGCEYATALLKRLYPDRRLTLLES